MLQLNKSNRKIPKSERLAKFKVIEKARNEDLDNHSELIYQLIEEIRSIKFLHSIINPYDKEKVMYAILNSDFQYFSDVIGEDLDTTFEFWSKGIARNTFRLQLQIKVQNRMKSIPGYYTLSSPFTKSEAEKPEAKFVDRIMIGRTRFKIAGRNDAELYHLMRDITEESLVSYNGFIRQRRSAYKTFFEKVKTLIRVEVSVNDRYREFLNENKREIDEMIDENTVDAFWPLMY